MAGAGYQRNAGALAITLAGASVAGAGSPRIVATLASTLTSATVASAGYQRNAGALAIALAGATIAGAGSPRIVGTSAFSPWTPDRLGAKLTNWYDASDASTLTLSGSIVVEWRDKSGNGRHLNTDSDTSKRPSFGATAFNSLPGVDYGSFQKWQQTSQNQGISGEYNVTFFMAHSTASASILGIYWSHGANASANAFSYLLGYNVNEAILSLEISQELGAFAWPGLAPKVVSGGKFGNLPSDYRLWGNGVPLTKTFENFDTTQNTTDTPLRITTGPSLGGGADQRVGEMVFAFGHALSDAERQNVEGYLAHRWNLASELPSNHPHKANAPTAPSLTLAGASVVGDGYQRNAGALAVTLAGGSLSAAGTPTLQGAGASTLAQALLAGAGYQRNAGALASTTAGATLTGAGTVTQPQGMSAYAQWLDPSDLSTLFQELTGASATTPSLVGDPVGSARNKGTLGGWFVAPFTSWRPTLRKQGGSYYLEYDATINSPVLALQTTGTPKLLQLFAATRVTGQETYGRIITAYDGTGADYGSSTGWTFSRYGGSQYLAFYSDATGPGNGAVVEFQHGTDFVIQTQARRDQNRARVNFGTAVTGTFGSNQTFPDLSYRYLGGETPISGRLYGAVGHLGTAVVLFDGSESDGTQLFQASSDTIQEWDQTVDATITEAQLAPDGTSTARLITEAVGGYRHVIYEVDYNVMPANTTQTFSIYLKSNGRRYAQILPAADGGGHWASVFVDLQDGVITDTDVIGGGANSQIIDTKVAQAGNGYWKVSVVFTLHAAAVVWHISLSDRPANTGLLDNQSPTYSGDGTSGIYMWRPKVVAGNVPAFNTPIALSNEAEDAVITYLQSKYADLDLLNGSESDGTQLFKPAKDTIAEWDDTVFGSITDGHLAPDGTSTASLFVESGDNRHLVYADDNLAVGADTKCTFSVYLKRNQRRYAQLLVSSSSGSDKVSLFVDLQQGTVTDSDIIGGGANSQIFASSVQDATNGYWKVSLCFRLHAAPTVWHVAMSDRATLSGGLSLDSPAYVADGSSMYLWRPKVVAGNSIYNDFVIGNPNGNYGGTWFNVEVGSTSLGSSIDGLPQPIIVPSNTADYGRRSTTINPSWTNGQTYYFKIEFNFGTSAKLYFVIYDGNDESVFTWNGTNIPYQTNLAGTISNVAEYTVGGHKELFFQIASIRTNPTVEIGVGPNSTVAGETITLFDYHVSSTAFIELAQSTDIGGAIGSSAISEGPLSSSS